MWNLINIINGKKTDKTWRIEKLNIDSKEYFDGKTISNDKKHAMIDQTYLLSITQTRFPIIKTVPTSALPLEQKLKEKPPVHYQIKTVMAMFM